MKLFSFIFLFSIYFCEVPLVSVGQATSPKQIVENFMIDVRSGKNPQNAGLYLADTVLAHQINAEAPETLKRTPRNYEDHVREFLKMYGNYSLKITGIIAEGDKVYVRWIQTGKHHAKIDGYPPTEKPLIEYASCVYLIRNRKISEYWIQIDRFGFQNSLNPLQQSKNDYIDTII